ncbi:MAG: MerR family transcriptional regulator [Magnetococcus sp. MYC-9]
MSDSVQAGSVEGMKIGVVAKRLGISIRTIHMYEREGLLIAHKNAAGTRYFNERDVEWLTEIRRLIKSGIGIAGIRHLLSLVPCWEIKGCIFDDHRACPVIVDHDFPCWAKKGNLCQSSLQECRRCAVHEIRFSVGRLKHRLQISLKSAPGEGSASSPDPVSELH